MSYRYLPPLLLLLMVTLVKAGVSQPETPGDEDPECIGTFPAVPNTIQLLDTRSYTDLGETLSLQLAARWNDSGVPCELVLHACTTTTDNAELRTQPIRYGGVAPEAVEITIEIEFSFNDSSPGCVGSLQFSTDTGAAPDAPVMPAITCEVDSPQTLFFPVSNLGELDLFRLILRAVADMRSPFFVDVTRFRVHVQQCPEAENVQAMYGEGLSGQTVTGVCVANSEVSAGSSLNATCGRDGMYDFGSAGGCECVAGYQPVGNECQACEADTFKPSGNVNCIPCPDNSAAPSGSAECACNPNYERSNSGDLTTDCDVCVMGAFQNGASCTLCPAGSSTTILNAVECDCDGDSTTSDGSTTTTGDPCGGADCSPGFFFINGRCEPCPYESDTSDTGATVCVCNSGYVDGTATTTTTGCSACAEDFYQSGTAGGGEAVCSACPANSERDTDMPAADGCPCITGFDRTDRTDLSSDCLVLYGFTSQELTFEESRSGILGVELAAASITETVTIIVQEDSTIGVTVDPSTLNFMPDDPIVQMITISINDNEVALEPDVSFSLSLQTADAIVGGGRYETAQVTVTDDDTVTVGFLSSSVSFNESDGQVMVVVGKSAEIASDLMLTVTGRIGGNSVSESVVFNPGPDNNQKTVSLTIPNDDTDNEDVVANLMLQLVSPNNRVIMGDDGTYFNSIEVTVVDDDPPEPSEGLATGAIIGIAAGAAGGAVLAACLCLICILICRFRVNRQGYYATYEDKATEPSMIRYSASLRSISSQTVVPAEGKAAVVTKENEFYV